MLITSIYNNNKGNRKKKSIYISKITVQQLHYNYTYPANFLA